MERIRLYGVVYILLVNVLVNVTVSNCQGCIDPCTKPTPCVDGTMTAIPGDCSKYHLCLYQDWIPQPCGGGTEFDHKTCTCDYPGVAACYGQCTTPGPKSTLPPDKPTTQVESTTIEDLQPTTESLTTTTSETTTQVESTTIEDLQPTTESSTTKTTAGNPITTTSENPVITTEDQVDTSTVAQTTKRTSVSITSHPKSTMVTTTTTTVESTTPGRQVMSTGAIVSTVLLLTVGICIITLLIVLIKENKNKNKVGDSLIFTKSNSDSSLAEKEDISIEKDIVIYDEFDHPYIKLW